MARLRASGSSSKESSGPPSRRDPSPEEPAANVGQEEVPMMAGPVDETAVATPMEDKSSAAEENSESMDDSKESESQQSGPGQSSNEDISDAKGTDNDDTKTREALDKPDNEAGTSEEDSEVENNKVDEVAGNPDDNQDSPPEAEENKTDEAGPSPSLEPEPQKESEPKSEIHLPRQDPGQSAIVQKPLERTVAEPPHQTVNPPQPLDAYSEEELEWVSSLVSLQTALLRKKMGEEESLRCLERLSSREQFEETDRSPDSSTVSGISYSGKVGACEK